MCSPGGLVHILQRSVEVVTFVDYVKGLSVENGSNGTEICQ